MDDKQRYWIEKWVEALRSRKFKQGRGWLAQKNKDGELEFCCWGVYCEITETPFSDRGSRREYSIGYKSWAAGSLQRYHSNIGVSADFINKTEAMNDGFNERPKSFRKIADYIEKELLQ